MPKTCKRSECRRPVVSIGLCKSHYGKHKYQLHKKKRENAIRGGVENNIKCHFPPCNGAPLGGGVYCQMHFYSEIVWK